MKHENAKKLVAKIEEFIEAVVRDMKSREVEDSIIRMEIRKELIGMLVSHNK